MPEEVLAYYRDAYPVHVMLADGLDVGAAMLTFTVWPEPDGPVSRVLVRFATQEQQQAACVLIARMAEALGWVAEDVTDEIE
jgi:hypothetical protein